MAQNLTLVSINQATLKLITAYGIVLKVLEGKFLVIQANDEESNDHSSGQV